MTTGANPDDAPVRALRIEIAPKTIALLLGVVAAIWVTQQLATVLMVITVALIFVGTFDPVVAWLERRGFRRGRALIVVFVGAALAFMAGVILMIPPLLAQLLDLIEHAPKERQHLVDSLEQYSWSIPLVKTLNDIPVGDLTADAGHYLIGYSTKLVELIGYGVSTLVLAIYLLADPARSKGLLYAAVPRHHHLKLATILLELKIIVGGYMRGQLITSAAIAGFVFVLLTILGADNALAIALFAGITDVIPFVGGYIATAPVVFAVFPQGPTVALIVLGVMILYQEFESRILVPGVYGKVLRLPPAVVLVSLLVGGSLAGLLGALLALPIAAGIRMILFELRVELPGVTSPHSVANQMDDRATEVYEHLTEGVSAAAAGVIADDFAYIVNKEKQHPAALAATVEPPLPEQADLEELIDARKRELLTMYNALKDDPRPEAIAAAAQMKERLDDLEQLLANGWDKMSASVKADLHAWLAAG